VLSVENRWSTAMPLVTWESCVLGVRGRVLGNNWANCSPDTEEIMRFFCLGYADEKTFETMSPEAHSAMMEEGFAFEEALRKAGHLVSTGETLQNASTAKTLRWINGKVMVTDGPFAETKEQLGGFSELEASDMNHATELLSKHPFVRFASFEIRPADEEFNALIAEKRQRWEEKTKGQSRSKA
jgi:hypothetical protein